MNNKYEPIVFYTNYNIESVEKLKEKVVDTNLDSKAQELLLEYPTVYIINSSNSNKKDNFSAYVGETNDIIRRTLEHLIVDPRNRDDFAEIKKSKDAGMYVIGEKHFNKSLTLDIENKLMQYLSSVPAIKKLNNRRFNEQNKYYDSTQFDIIFNNIWNELNRKNPNLFPRKRELENKAIFKSSPFNKLNYEQLKAKNEIINSAKASLLESIYHPIDKEGFGKLILVEGMAGSGKTVLVSNIFYDLVNESKIMNEYNSKNNLKISMIVNQSEQLKVYKEIAKKFFDKNNSMRVFKPSQFINKVDTDNKEDIVIVDEAHLLLTQQSQSYHHHGTKMIEDILRRSKIVIAVYDPKQILSIASVVEPNYIEELVDKTHGKTICLHNQMRIDANKQTIQWINNMIDCGVIGKIPQDNKYEIKVFDTPQEMQNQIVQKNEDKNMGISRMIATFDWKYSGGKEKLPSDQKYWEVRINNWSMPWNYEIKRRDNYEVKHHQDIKYSDLSWAEKDYTINEIGSTYTIQGFDLNYAGVILGPSVKYRNGRIIHDPNGSHNPKAINKRDSSKSYAKELLNNEFNVLMTRGVHGLYIYAVDDQLRNKLKNSQQNK